MMFVLRFVYSLSIRIIPLSLLFIVGSSAHANKINTVYQVATIGSLSQGVYDGDTKIGQLSAVGDFGLGTFQGLDGEMVALNGKYYKIDATGKLTIVNSKQLTPFAQVTKFNPSRIIPIKNAKSYQKLAAGIVHQFANRNIPYAIRIDGVFKTIKLRSLRKQGKPYRPLVVAAKEQAVFHLKNTKGTIVGFWFPQYWAGIAVPGFHLHFVNDGRTIGGHVLDLNLKAGKLSLESLHHVEVYMPKTALFAHTNLSSRKIMRQIRLAEGGG